MLAIVCENSSAEHLINSAGISSCPLARPVLSLPIASVTSSDVIGGVNCDGSPVNASSPSTVESVNCRLKWSVTRVLISAELEMLRPACSADIAAISGQCCQSCRPVGAVRPMVDSALLLVLLLPILCRAAFYCRIIAHWRSGQEELVRS